MIMRNGIRAQQWTAFPVLGLEHMSEDYHGMHCDARFQIVSL